MGTSFCPNLDCLQKAVIVFRWFDFSNKKKPKVCPKCGTSLVELGLTDGGILIRRKQLWRKLSSPEEEQKMRRENKTREEEKERCEDAKILRNVLPRACINKTNRDLECNVPRGSSSISNETSIKILDNIVFADKIIHWANVGKCSCEICKEIDHKMILGEIKLGILWLMKKQISLTEELKNECLKK